MNWEIWADPYDNSTTLIQAGRHHYGSKQSKKIYEFKASSFEEALKIKYQYLNLGEYIPSNNSKKKTVLFYKR
jgi:hypothetical protein